MVDDGVELRCTSCGHEWTEVMPLPMEVDAFAHRLIAVRCPRCAARSSRIKLRSDS